MNEKVNQVNQKHIISADGLVVQKLRTDMTITLKAGNGKVCGPTYMGGYFEPRKIVVTWWPEDTTRMRARVGCSGVPGKSKYSYQPGGNTCTYNLSGYDSYLPCPEWLARLVRELGYQHPIERIV